MKHFDLRVNINYYLITTGHLYKILNNLKLFFEENKALVFGSFLGKDCLQFDTDNSTRLLNYASGPYFAI